MTAALIRYELMYLLLSLALFAAGLTAFIIGDVIEEWRKRVKNSRG